MEASLPRAATAAVIRLFATVDGVDPILLKALEQGTYVVDPHAVAEAIVRRHEQLADARRLAVLVAAQVDDPAIFGVELDEPSAGADVA
ncbi:MAG: hypothetical protein QOF55_1623 [Thermoleophilaceae bacterium]|jgi:hypothetical protein|nr:hypothetical protein [Thermoleophilaceae bacterium]